MRSDDFNINKDKLAEPDHYPEDVSTESSYWYSNIIFPTTSEELILEYGDQIAKDKNGEEKSLKDILSNYPDRKFKSLQELSEVALADITDEKYKGTKSSRRIRLGG